MNLMRLAAIVAAALTLAGCYMSKTPLLDSRDAAFPISPGTYIRVSELDGSRKQVVFARRGAWYMVTPEGEGPRQMMFQEIEGFPDADSYAYMVKSGSEYYYGVMVFYRRHVEEILPDCREDRDAAAAVGVVANKDGECEFTDRAQLIEALEAVARDGRADYRIEERGWGDPRG